MLILLAIFFNDNEDRRRFFSVYALDTPRGRQARFVGPHWSHFNGAGWYTGCGHSWRKGWPYVDSRFDLGGDDDACGGTLSFADVDDTGCVTDIEQAQLCPRSVLLRPPCRQTASSCSDSRPVHRVTVQNSASQNTIRANNTIRYDSVYLTCSKKLMNSQLGLPHGINKKLKCETKNKMMSVIASKLLLTKWSLQTMSDSRYAFPNLFYRINTQCV